MSSPYPRDVSHGTLDEELHDIQQVQRALARLERSPNIDLPDCVDVFKNGLEQQRDGLATQRTHNVRKDALLDALTTFDDNGDKGYDELAQDALEAISSNRFGQQALIDALNSELDYEYKIEDEEEAIRTIEALAEDIAAGRY